eukprot:XP_001608787.1 hypothetical protein [Babesia bovis T2Bo]
MSVAMQKCWVPRVANDPISLGATGATSNTTDSGSGNGGFDGIGGFGVEWTYPIYGIAVVILGILGGTLYCGWKCNLFCRPCCKSQYMCYGSAIVVVLVILIVLAVTASIVRFLDSRGFVGYEQPTDGQNEILTIGYFCYIIIPITQIYTITVLWNTTFKLPYTVLEVVALLASALAVASLLAVVGGTQDHQVAIVYSLLTLHLVSLGITWYCLQYKEVFHWPKQYLCFGLLAAVVILVAFVLVVIHIVDPNEQKDEAVQYILLGYSMVLMVPTLWYAYRCGLLTWKWNSCIPKKSGLKATDTAENKAAGTDITTE